MSRIAATAPAVAPWTRPILFGDFVERLGGLLGQPLDLAGDDREAPARLARPRRLDRGVEGQQVGSSGD
jgi:hypothetical protein